MTQNPACTSHDRVNELCPAKLLSILHSALDAFDRRHEFLLANSIGEPCLNHQLAVILKKFFPQHDVDCEYNRVIGMHESIRKQLPFSDADLHDNFTDYSSWSEAQKENANNKLVTPDIIIHTRGEAGPNLVAIEAKRQTNTDTESKRFDRIKLRKYSEAESKLRYEFGVYIEYHDGAITGKGKRIHLIEIYRQGEKIFDNQKSMRCRRICIYSRADRVL